jgi:hypothetical protein
MGGVSLTLRLWIHHSQDASSSDLVAVIARLNLMAVSALTEGHAHTVCIDAVRTARLPLG